VKAKANEAAAELASMDDEALYGKTLFTRGFGWTVENGLLTDYKVLVLAVDEAMVSGGVQNRLADGAPCERARGQAGWRPINDRG
jgi:predicted helicase